MRCELNNPIRKLNEKEIWDMYFSKLTEPKILSLLKKLKNHNCDEIILENTELAQKERRKIVQLIKKLEQEGIKPIHSTLYRLSQNNKTLFIDLFKEFSFTEEEKINIFTQYLEDKNEENAYPSLNLSSQLMTSIPKEIGLVNMRIHFPDDYVSIDLSANSINKLSTASMKVLNNFDIIHLIGAEFKELPPSIKLLNKPLYLNFSWSKLEKLPDEIYSLTQLKKLSFNWTRISDLSYDIKHLTNLKSMEISDTPLVGNIELSKKRGVCIFPEDNEMKKHMRKVRSILSKIGCELLYS